MKKVFALLLCGLLFAGCGSAQESTSESISESIEKSVSESSASGHDIEFIELDGLTFGYLADWTPSEQTDDSVTFFPNGDKSVGVMLYISDYDTAVSEMDFYVEFVASHLEMQDNYDYEFKTSGDKLVLYEKYINSSGANVLNYATIYGDHLISAMCMSKKAIPTDVQAFAMAMIHPVDGVE